SRSNPLYLQLPSFLLFTYRRLVGWAPMVHQHCLVKSYAQEFSLHHRQPRCKNVRNWQFATLLRQPSMEISTLFEIFKIKIE
ncbi:MAG: hypothetical protein ACTSY1_12060, partial [Alphaproteobacteria bacterium]